MKRTVILSATLLLAAQHAAAQFRCDCTSIVDTCTAEVSVRGGAIDVTTDRPQCARVDYFVDGQPFVSLAIDGEARENWLARTVDPRVIVQSCQVCRENAPSATTLVPRAPEPAAADNAEAPANAGLAPLIEVAPTYPPAALARGVQGYVDVEFTVTPNGAVENARVTGAQPTGLFEPAAIAAVTRSRYPSDPARAPLTQTKRVQFVPPAAPPAPAARVAASAPGATGPRNQCVREDAVYNFGEMIEVSLLNACAEPLLVYSCAEGTGRHANRWTCTDSERQTALLAPAGRQTPSGDSLNGYAALESFVVTRAPNSQYWWMACREADVDCRAGARQWIRAVDGQPATVDPQNRASMAVARSY